MMVLSFWEIQNSGKVQARYMEGICKVYARYMQAICSLYVGYMLAICQLYVGYMLAICWLYVGYIKSISKAGDEQVENSLFNGKCKSQIVRYFGMTLKASPLSNRRSERPAGQDTINGKHSEGVPHQLQWATAFRVGDIRVFSVRRSYGCCGY